MELFCKLLHVLTVRIISYNFETSGTLNREKKSQTLKTIKTLKKKEEVGKQFRFSMFEQSMCQSPSKLLSHITVGLIRRPKISVQLDMLNTILISEKYKE